MTTMASWLIWPIALALLLPFMGWGPKLRVWLVLLISSVVTWWFYGPFAYLMVDLCAAYFVTNKPRGTHQRYIGAVFALMAVFHIGYVFSSQSNDGLYISVLQFLSWMQLAILGGWGVRDALRIYHVSGGSIRGVLAADKARIR